MVKPSRVPMPWYAFFLCLALSGIAVISCSTIWSFWVNGCFLTLTPRIVHQFSSVLILIWIFSVCRNIWKGIHGGAITTCILAIMGWLTIPLWEHVPNGKYLSTLTEFVHYPIITLVCAILLIKLPGARAWSEYRCQWRIYRKSNPGAREDRFPVPVAGMRRIRDSVWSWFMRPQLAWPLFVLSILLIGLSIASYYREGGKHQWYAGFDWLTIVLAILGGVLLAVALVSFGRKR